MKKYKIFLVDDDPIFLEMLKESLIDNENFIVEGFKSGEECLKRMNENPYIVVLDHYLNSKDKTAKDGLTVLREIKIKFPDIRVIILSAQEDGKLVYEFTASHACDYIIKDDDAFENLLETIEDLIQLDEDDAIE